MGGHYKNVVSVQPKRDDFVRTTNPRSDALANVDQIVIKQHLSMIEAVTDFDRVNRYYVWNGKTGEQIFTASEGDIGCCARNFFEGSREFEMPFVTKEGDEAFQLSKSRSVTAMGCLCGVCCGACSKACAVACCGYDDEFSNLTVNHHGTPNYYIKQNPQMSGAPNFSIIDKQTDKAEFTVSMDSCCFNAYNCTDVVYDVTNNSGTVVATITKWWGGGKGGLEACCIESANASTWVIDVSTTMEVKQKMGLIGATLLLDYSFYQIKGDGGGN